MLKEPKRTQDIGELMPFYFTMFRRKSVHLTSAYGIPHLERYGINLKRLNVEIHVSRCEHDLSYV